MDIFTHNFKGFGSFPSKCKVYIKVIDDIHHICFEDLGIGTSITNASEQLATEIREKYGLNPELCKFYETYNYDDRTFDEIIYTWENGIARSPEWMPSDNEKIFDF